MWVGGWVGVGGCVCMCVGVWVCGCVGVYVCGCGEAVCGMGVEMTVMVLQQH